ncbi:hypothetical protein TNCV_2728971 [Trichonephila clavipes]|nr:hypothetical protein TNCV_2728971 [Trichonephila clavipes]
MKYLIALLILEVIIKLIDAQRNHHSKDVVCDPVACVDPCKLNTNPGGCPFCDCGVVGLSLQHLLRYRNDGDDVVHHIIAEHKIWCHHFQPEVRQHAMEISRLTRP